MLVDRARQVGLLDKPQQVFERRQHQRRGRLGDVAQRSIDRRCGLIGRRQSAGDAGMGEGAPQPRAVLLANLFRDQLTATPYTAYGAPQSLAPSVRPACVPRDPLA